MTRVVGDVCFPSGKYIDRETNEEKTRWMKCGILLETDKGMRLMLEAIPTKVGENGMWFSIFENDRQKAPAKPKPAEGYRQASADPQEDIPF